MVGVFAAWLCVCTGVSVKGMAYTGDCHWQWSAFRWMFFEGLKNVEVLEILLICYYLITSFYSKNV
tara:strand:- start:178 stop:375 length:198 start_codon:yes stop_codon:yes gene_type:complete